MKPISYINSILDMQTPLVKRKMLLVKRAKALKSELVKPYVEMEKDTSLEMLKNTVQQANEELETKQIVVPESLAHPSKYQPKIIKG